MSEGLSLTLPDTERFGGSAAVMDRVAILYDTYSALLLYSGGFPVEIYHSVIRQRMVSSHPAFSGTWARDYERVLLLLQSRSGQRSETLREALKTNRLVHMAVAKRLVPSGGSLLRDSGTTHAPVAEANRRLFDSFFGTARGPVCRTAFIAALRRRVDEILRDISEYPLDVQYGSERVDAVQENVVAQMEWLGVAAADGPGLPLRAQHDLSPQVDLR